MKASKLTASRLLQIIRNDSKPAHEIVAEKELSSFSRFTRNKSVHTHIPSCPHPPPSDPT